MRVSSEDSETYAWPEIRGKLKTVRELRITCGRSTVRGDLEI